MSESQPDEQPDGELFIEGIIKGSVHKASNGVEYMDVVPNDHFFNAIGETSSPSQGRPSGPVVLRPIYYGIYEEMKYRQKFLPGANFHCISGTPGIGKSFMAPFLAMKFMEDRPDAIIAYWNAKNLYLFSKTAYPTWLDPYKTFHKRTIDDVNEQVNVMKRMCESVVRKIIIIRDPPQNASSDNAGDMAQFAASTCVTIASYGCYLIPQFASKGKAQFYYVHPWDMTEIEMSVSAGLIIGFADRRAHAKAAFAHDGSDARGGSAGGPFTSTGSIGIASGLAVASKDKDDGSEEDSSYIAEDVGAASHASVQVDQKQQAEGEESHGHGGSDSDSDLPHSLPAIQVEQFRHVKKVYEEKRAHLRLATGASQSLLELRERYTEVGGSLRTLLLERNTYALIKTNLAGKVATFFNSSSFEIPTAPSFVDRQGYFGSILHKVPTETCNENTPLGLFFSSWKWASPMVETLAVEQVLSNVVKFANRFATVVGGSANVFEGQCHRDLTQIGQELNTSLRVLSPDKTNQPDRNFRWNCQKVVHFSTQSAMRRLLNIGEGSYCRPFVVNFPTADSFAIVKKSDFYGDEAGHGKAPSMVVAFQMTVSDSQSTDPKPSHVVRVKDELAVLTAVQHQLGGGKNLWSGVESKVERAAAILAGKNIVDKLALVFLVPSNCVDGMTYRTPMTAQRNSRTNQSVGIDTNQYVMSLDSSWDATLKSFVESQDKKRRHVDRPE